MIYLASPYSHPDGTVREERFQAACQAAAMLLRAGHLVYSPIAHSHPIALYGLRTDWSSWEASNRKHLETCSEVVVLTLDGWEASIGVQAELRLADELGVAIRYLDSVDAPAAGPRVVAPTLAHVGPEMPH